MITINVYKFGIKKEEIDADCVCYDFFFDHISFRGRIPEYGGVQQPQTSGIWHIFLVLH